MTFNSFVIPDFIGFSQLLRGFNSYDLDSSTQYVCCPWAVRRAVCGAALRQYSWEG
jgi:hypothetical protein